MTSFRKVLIVGLFVASSSLIAQEKAKENPWRGEAELGVVITSGNTENQSINAKAKVNYQTGKWVHGGVFEALNTKDDVSTTAERFLVSGKSTYSFKKYDYLFGIVTYEDDRFNGYDYQVSASIGYGRRLIDQEDMKLNVEAGPGMRQSKLDNGNTEDEFIVRGAGNFQWKFSEASAFTEDLSIEIGEESTITRSVSAITAQIVGSLALKASFSVKNTSEVPVGTEKTDTETSLTLVYAF